MPLTHLDSARPRVSRETRLLLATVLISLAALWVLARLRFPERPATANPVPPVLTQLAPASAFDDLAFVVSQLSPRLTPVLMAIDVWRDPGIVNVASSGNTLPALRIGDDIAVTLIRPALGVTRPASPDATLVARDRASGFSVLRVRSENTARLMTWSTRRLDYPRYLIAGDVSREGVSLRPVFVGSLHPVTTPLWSEPIWTTPARTDLAAGTFVFTTDGALAGLVTEHDTRPTIVPGDLVLGTANRLLREGNTPPGQLGINVQPLTPNLAAATGATTGVVVTWVDPRGPADGRVAVTDVIEAVDGEPIVTPAHWQARVARLDAGESITLRVRRRSDVHQVLLVATPAPAASPEVLLGLTMASRPRIGTAVLRVQPQSSAARAGIVVGDIITIFGELKAPTPAQVSRAFATRANERPILVAITRGEAHLVLTLTKE